MIGLYKDRTWVVFLFLFSLFVFTRSLSIHGVEYRDDEIFYYQSSSEMLKAGNFLSPTYFGEDRFQKPILFYWFVILFYKLFGINWFAARLTAVFFAAFSVCFTYALARRFFSQRVAALSSLILITIPLFLRHAKNVVPDMALNFFIVSAIYYGVCYFQETDKKKFIYFFYIMSGLGFMVKGLAALAVPLGTMVIFLLATKRGKIKELKLLEGIAVWLVLILPWFIYMTAIHGKGYLDYMVVEETKNRIVGDGASNLLLVQGRRLIDHLLFYLRTILTYFLPWSLIGLVGIPVQIIQRKKMEDQKEKEGFILCAGWMILVLMIFSNMYFRISHYMLVMTVPFAIAVSYFILDFYKKDDKAQRQLASVTSILLLLILGMGFFAYSFLYVFLAQHARWWLAIFVLIYLSLVILVMRTSKPINAAAIVSVFILFVFSQSTLMANAGVSSHGTLQRFAQTINDQPKTQQVIGVGSHDLHEKEFQVYFDSPLIKAGHSNSGRMQLQLRELFDRKEEVYCLLTQKDYNEYLSLFDSYHTEVIEREPMVRKRMKLDQGFVKALFRLDGAKVREYLMEEIVLIRKK